MNTNHFSEIIFISICQSGKARDNFTDISRPIESTRKIVSVCIQKLVIVEIRHRHLAWWSRPSVLSLLLSNRCAKHVFEPEKNLSPSWSKQSSLPPPLNMWVYVQKTCRSCEKLKKKKKRIISLSLLIFKRRDGRDTLRYIYRVESRMDFPRLESFCFFLLCARAKQKFKFKNK